MEIDWNFVTSVFAVVGLFLTGSGVFYAARQLRLSRKLAKNEFSLQLFAMVQGYNEIVHYLTGDGWPTKSKLPESSADWDMVMRYMGFLEMLQDLVEDGILTLDEVDMWFSYRVATLLSHPAIQQRCLEEERHRWPVLIRLQQSLERYPTYRSVMEAKDRKAAGHS